VATSNALFVGDSITDVETARAAGCPVVCVRDGYNHGTPAAQLGADAVIDSLIQLL
jgi:phosphoglycolate phosphatase